MDGNLVQILTYSMSQYILALIGGFLIGCAALVLMLFNGRILGVSGILGSIFDVPRPRDLGWRLAFILTVVGSGVISQIFLKEDAVHFFYGFEMNQVSSSWVILLSGLLVGYGTRLGSGCTSGHGVCGNSRLSKRSMIATVIFILSGMLVVWVRKFF